MPQQDRAFATREAILVAAAEEFDRFGYDRAPLSMILDRGGVTKGAFYFHFPSKEALASALVQMQDDTWPKVVRTWQERGLDPLRTLVGLCRDSVALMSRDVVLRAGVRLAADQELGYPGLATSYRRWEKIIADFLFAAREEGQLLPDADPEAGARVLCSSALGARLVSATMTRCVDYPDRMLEIWRFLLPGLVAEKWRPVVSEIL